MPTVSLRTMVPRVSRVAIGLLLAATVAGCDLESTGPGTNQGDITGYVGITGDGPSGGTLGVADVAKSVPLSGATVLLDSGQRIATTDTAGRYSFTAVAPGEHVVTMSDSQAWNTANATIEVVAGRSVEVVPASLGRCFYVLIGVNDYENLPSNLDLHGPENDVAAFRQSLGSAAVGRTTVLTGSSASKAAIHEAIETYAHQMTRDDYMLFYFSGHGSAGKSDYAGVDGRDCILPWDASLTDGSTMITDGELATWLQDVPGGNATVVLDSCYSGAFADGNVTRGLGTTGRAVAPLTTLALPALRALSTVGHFALLAGARADEEAWEEWGHGLFTTALTDALGPAKREADTNHDRVVSTREVYEYCRAHLYEQTPAMWPDPSVSQYADYQGPAMARY